MMRRAQRREYRSKKMQPNCQLSDVRVVLRVGRGRGALRHVVAQVLQEQAHHAALALRPHHHLMHREIGIIILLSRFHKKKTI